MRKGVSIIICTYNGAARIPATIAHVAAQQLPGDVGCEVIFADNASTDESSAVAAAEWAKHGAHIPCRIIQAPIPGKIHALQQAVSLAQFPYFIICDDDNWLAPGYAATVHSILDNDPLIGAVGGQSAAETNGLPLPDWFGEVAKDYAVGPQAPQSGDVSRRGYLWGAGLGSRTALFKQLYEHFPSLLTGRKENKLTAGEDTEYCQRLLLKGYRLHYDERLQFRHFIPENRLTTAYRDGLITGLEASNTVLDKYYLATRLQAKCAGKPLARYRLLLKAAFKYLFAGSAKKAEQEKDTVDLLLPFDLKRNPVISSIKRFL